MWQVLTLYSVYHVVMQIFFTFATCIHNIKMTVHRYMLDSIVIMGRSKNIDTDDRSKYFACLNIICTMVHKCSDIFRSSNDAYCPSRVWKNRGQPDQQNSWNKQNTHLLHQDMCSHIKNQQRFSFYLPLQILRSANLRRINCADNTDPASSEERAASQIKTSPCTGEFLHRQQRKRTLTLSKALFCIW